MVGDDKSNSGKEWGTSGVGSWVNLMLYVVSRVESRERNEKSVAENS